MELFLEDYLLNISLISHVCNLTKLFHAFFRLEPATALEVRGHDQGRNEHSEGYEK